MNVAKVVLLKDQALFDSVYFEGAEFYITAPRRAGGWTREMSDIFDDQGVKLGLIEGHYFDFGNKDVFELVEDA